jgi:diamine N-acetyltransferase
MNQFIIRGATTEDADLIADISRYTFYKTFAKDNKQEDIDHFMYEQFGRQKLVDEVFDAENIFLLAFDKKQVAGYTKIKTNILTTKEGSYAAVEIARLYVMPEYIGCGVGSTLMQSCIDYARTQKRETVWLGVWKKNQRAIDFYKKWGFEKFATHFFQLGDDVQTDWLMRKWI